MEAFLITIFCYTSILYFFCTLFKGVMFYKPWIVAGQNFKIRGTGARIFSAFVIIFLSACVYFWIPENRFINGNVYYSNLAAGVASLVLAYIFWRRNRKYLMS